MRGVGDERAPRGVGCLNLLAGAETPLVTDVVATTDLRTENT